ncbi:hypothetical protein CYMTET_6995 [Cymbomonas tetramitiformis]|uniref:Ubiquitin thioesterase OTU n=1 Tax=Cymbomonas tetramitiformis TaxID=36881 RepID=A0AAE0GWC8_9CHLO|nr:hypothetical protein CYMTET_6995 [Cymbomonas tetramitiformis]
MWKTSSIRTLAAVAATVATTAVVSLTVASADASNNDWQTIRVAGDGNCLFRAVAQGAAVRSGQLLLSSHAEGEAAAALRKQSMDELVKRREECEWFIEGDFETYVARMRTSHTWGGEPEILMMTHVLKSPITVVEAASQQAIAEYGQEYSDDSKPIISILFHQAGHYEALVLLTPRSKL